MGAGTVKEFVRTFGQKLFTEILAGRQGLEPRYADPESAVLPLDDLPEGLILASAGAFPGEALSLPRAYSDGELCETGTAQIFQQKDHLMLMVLDRTAGA